MRIIITLTSVNITRIKRTIFLQHTRKLLYNKIMSFLFVRRSIRQSRKNKVTYIMKNMTKWNVISIRLM